MIEKIMMKDYLGTLPTGTPNKLPCLDYSGNHVTSSAQKIVDVTNSVQMELLYGTKTEASYCLVATITLYGSGMNQEGILNNVILNIIGGSNYASPNSILYLSLVCHRDVVISKKNSIIGNLEIGYTKSNSKVEIWVKANTYCNLIYASILGAKDSRISLVNSLRQTVAPEGYIAIE